MAGTAITTDFMLSVATVMLGAPADIFDLNPTEHSIGLVKNFTLSSEPTYTELTQGVTGDIVFSKLTSNPTRAAMEVYEYTAKNLAYALGLDASAVTPQTVETTTTAAIPASPATAVLPVTAATGITAGKVLLIEADGSDDNLVIRTVVSVSSLNVTVDEILPAMASGVKVYVVNSIDVGTKVDQPFLAAKIAGSTANGIRTVIHIPKLRITKGFSLGFVSDSFSNLPFEFTLYDMVTTDSLYSKFKGVKAKIYRK